MPRKLYVASRRQLCSGLAGLIIAAFASGCRRGGPDSSPEPVVREFVDILRGFHGDEAQSKALYELLSNRAKRNLRERAERYGAASGKQMEPWAMLVPSRMGPRFVPEQYRAQLAGKYAMVEVVGRRPSDRVQIPCVLEDNQWRVDLVLPELPPLRRRPSSVTDE